MTKGIRTTYGSKIFEHYVPDVDSAVYEKLTKAGAVLLGKNGMHELAFGLTSDNPHFGPVRNPRNPACIPGGSSGGSAAAVASMSIGIRAEAIAFMPGFGYSVAAASLVGQSLGAKNPERAARAA